MTGDLLQIPCLLSKVTTLLAGGHRLTFDAFETSAEQVKELIGTENKQHFVLCLVKVDSNGKAQNVKVGDKRCPKPKPKTQP